jgi:circadian clock protein KaiB
VVDLLLNPQLARDDQILASPTLVRKLPPPIRKVIGDLSDTERVLVALQLRPAKEKRERGMPTDADRQDSLADFERLAADVRETRYLLSLYVSGMTLRSTAAIERTRAICEEHLPGRYELEVIDIYLDPGVARREQIVAAPTLVKSQPLPIRRLVGDLSDRNRVLTGLDLRKMP